MNSKKRYMVIALLALLVVSAMAYNDEAKPWTFWNWKYGSVSRPGIHADLTGMKNVGMGGIWLMPVREAGERLEFQDGVPQLSPEFWKMMDYSFQLADSLDLIWASMSCLAIRLSSLLNRCRRLSGPIPL